MCSGVGKLVGQVVGRVARGNDALEPAALKSQELVSVSLDESLIAVAEVARAGMEATKDLMANVGKAKPLGKRSLGHPDPGAVSTYLILKYMTEYVSGGNTNGPRAY